MSKLSITRNYSDNDAANTITAAKLTDIATQLNAYFNSGNITGEQIRVDGLTFDQMSLTDFVDGALFDVGSSSFSVANLSDVVLSELDGDVLLGDGAVTWDKHIVGAGSVSTVTVGSTAYVQASVGVDLQLGYTPDDIQFLTAQDDPTPLLVTDNALGVTGSAHMAFQVDSTGHPLCVALVPGSTSSHLRLKLNGGIILLPRIRFKLFRLAGTEDDPSVVISTGTEIQSLQVYNIQRERGIAPLVMYDFTAAADTTYTYVITSDNLLGLDMAVDIAGMQLIVYEMV